MTLMAILYLFEVLGSESPAELVTMQTLLRQPGAFDSQAL